MFIDSHCHLDAAEFDEDRARIVADAGLRAILVPAVQRENFAVVRAIAHNHRGIGYALGIHPMYVQQAQDEDLDHLEASLSEYISDPRLIAVGEIGLDFFIPEISVGLLREKQERFYQAQLKLAYKFGLPVILHVRRSQDVLLKYLRRIKVSGGIAHAFNGSPQQAKVFLEHGFCLGFGGAMTYSRALQIRRLAQSLPESAMVLETDSPDIPPEWLHRDFLALSPEQRPFQKRLLRNTPTELPRIAQCLAALRECTVESVARFTNENVLRVLPRMSEVMLHGS
jgi:TatD DNase family protein